MFFLVASLASLASGTKGNLLANMSRTAVSVAAHPFLVVMTSTKNATDYVTGLVVDYDQTRKEADMLEQELMSQVARATDYAELKAENARLRSMLEFKNSEPRLELQPAAVQIIGRFEGTLILDQGSVHGVREFMCALTRDGIVGIVTKVEPFQAYVYTLHHAECKIGAMVRETGVTGVVHGSGSDFSHICRMVYIDLKDDVFPGQTVVTSGSGVFPRGYPIGTITEVHGERGLLKSAYIRPAADPYRLSEVFLIQRAQPTVEELAGPKPYDDASHAPLLPDERSLQERYAP